MTIWSTPDGRMASAVGLACWAQLCLVPLAHRADALTVAAAAAALLALLGGTFDVLRRPRLAVPLATVGFFALCALESALLARHPVPRFDFVTRILAGVTAAGYVALLARSRGVVAPRVPGVVAPLPSPPVPASGPRMRPLALAALAVVVVGCALVIPAWIAAGASAEGAGRSAARLLRGRTALTASGGAGLAVLVALVAGPALLRAEPPRPRRAARAVTYGVWALVAWTMRAWLERAR